MTRLIVVVLAALAAWGCETLGADAATRIRYGLRDAAERLRQSGENTLVVIVQPNRWPDGCGSSPRYRVRLVPYRGGKQVPAADVFVTCAGGREYSTGTRLDVPREMSVDKNAAETVRLTLRKAGGTIEVAALE